MPPTIFDPVGDSWITRNAPAAGTPYHPTPGAARGVSELIVEALGD